MATADDILATVLANLAQPKRARTDAGEIEQHDLDLQIEAAKFALQMTTSKASSPFACLRLAQCSYPGAN